MSKGAYVGIGGKAQKVKKMYVGVDNKARKVKKMYVGVDNKARLVWQSSVPTFSTGEYYSLDNGATWTFSSSNANRNVYALTYGDKFLASHSSYIGTSDDAISWTFDNSVITQCFDLSTYGNGKYVLAHYGENISTMYYSSDAATWTATTLSCNKKFLCFGGGKFLVGATPGSVSKIALYCSTDAVNWTSAVTLSPPNSVGNYPRIQYGNGRFWLTTETPYIYYSSDGKNWTQSRVVINNDYIYPVTIYSMLYIDELGGWIAHGRYAPYNEVSRTTLFFAKDSEANDPSKWDYVIGALSFDGWYLDASGKITMVWGNHTLMITGASSGKRTICRMNLSPSAPYAGRVEASQIKATTLTNETIGINAAQLKDVLCYNIAGGTDNNDTTKEA